MKKTEFSIKAVKHQRGLIIGLGGSGGATLASNRRRMIERYQDLESVPMVRYLYLDTDPKWYQSHHREVEKNLRLSEQEFVDLQFPAAGHLYNGMKKGKYPHYNWFEVSKLENLRSVTDGAGTVRQMARLAFWHHYTKVREAIVRQLNALRPDAVATRMRNNHGIQLDDGVTVYIVAGLGGGTGSGLWLDTAFLVRKVLKDLGITGTNQIVGYGVLPQAFRDLDGANVMANGYALLKELNYFSYLYSPNNQLAPVFGEPLWTADYLRNQVDCVTFKRQPPFDYCYLVDARNAHVDLHRKDIFHMVDTAIFHEFAGNFAPFKRSLRANIKNRLLQNDTADCPCGFMSFGQSAALVPLSDIKEVLSCQLARQAVLGWLDRKSVGGPTAALNNGAEGDTEEAAVSSIRTKAADPALVVPVRGWIVRDFINAQGLTRGAVFNSIVQAQHERLTDVPHALVEAQKETWITEAWPVEGFMGRVKHCSEKWRTDFNDEAADRMQWGEHIRKLEANKAAATKTYQAMLRKEAFRLFEHAEYGPAWAVCSLQQLRAGLAQLKQGFINEAANANAIATALGDVYLIEAVTTAQGPSLSAIIETKAAKDLDRLDEAVKKWQFFNKTKAVRELAYQYLQSCSHWCRAKVEERSRREAAELIESIIECAVQLEDELLRYAATLAHVEGALNQQLRDGHQRAMDKQNVGVLLFDEVLLAKVEAKLRERRGDQFSPVLVGQNALRAMGKSLRELRRDEVPALIGKLKEAAHEAVGDLTETGSEDTDFAAHDLLSAVHTQDDTLDGVIREVIRKSSPYVRLTAAVEDGGWNEGSDLLTIDGAGLRGGGPKDSDPDKDHERVIASLERTGWNVRDGVQPVEEPGQVMFFQECGGFPLRALEGIAEMKAAYEQHRQQPNSPPLHIVSDEMASVFPDLYPPEPELLERARVMQSVALPLGFIAQREFPTQTGNRLPQRLYAFLRPIKELGEEQPIQLGATVEAVGMKLANDTALLAELEQVVEGMMRGTTAADRAKFAGLLSQYLRRKQEDIRAANGGLEPQNDPAYQAEQGRVVAFMQRHNLRVGAESTPTVPRLASATSGSGT